MIVSLTSTGSAEFMATLQRLDQQLAGQALKATAGELEKYVGEEAGKHSKTGALFHSVYSKPVGDGGDMWEIGHDLQRAPHALFVHWGTKPHVIRPKRPDGFESKVKAHTRKGRPVVAHTREGKAMLRWAGPGGFVFGREVHHPGNEPDKWLERAAAMAPKLFERHVNALMSQALKE
jgi:hypothetical protein